jgi:hypothetical protein
MIESALNRTPDSVREDAGYKSWEASARKAVMRHDLNERTAGPIPSFGSMVHETALAAQGMHYAPHGYSPAMADGTASSAMTPDIAYEGEKDNEFSFGDVIDIINPLQHLPVIGTLYRKITGDTMGSFSGIVGSTIFGGPLGAISSGINLALKESTGKDLAENAMSLVGFDVTPAVKKPSIHIEGPARYAGAGTENSLAVANLYEKTAGGHKNFAAKDAAYSWNT